MIALHLHGLSVAINLAKWMTSALTLQSRSPIIFSTSLLFRTFRQLWPPHGALDSRVWAWHYEAPVESALPRSLRTSNRPSSLTTTRIVPRVYNDHPTTKHPCMNSRRQTQQANAWILTGVMGPPSINGYPARDQNHV